MLVTLTSPRNGSGQTLLSIVMAMRLAITTAGKDNAVKTSLVDLNKRQDIDYYLSETPLDLGLDSFCSGMESRMITKTNDFVRKCTKKVQGGLYISSANEQYNLKRTIVSDFLNFSREFFNYSIVDGRIGDDVETMYFFEKSDFVIVVIDQDKFSTNLIKTVYAPLYKRMEGKIIFVVNRTLEQVNLDIKIQLNQAKLNPKIFYLPYSIALRNEANDKVLYNFVNKKIDESYIGVVDDIIAYLLGVSEV